MSKRKKGLSLDEKRKVILCIYHESLTPFNLKEIEQLASKRGVVQQSVKEVNQSLVDDGFVCCDKIGSSNFFWSFPLKVIITLYIGRIYGPMTDMLFFYTAIIQF